MNRPIIFLLVLFVCAVACVNRSEYPGFSRTKSGIDYKLLRVGDDDRKALAGDYVTVDLVYKTMDDSVFFSGRRKIQVPEKKTPGIIGECLAMMAKDEERLFIVPVDSFFTETIVNDISGLNASNGKVKIDISMIDIQTEREYENEKEAFLGWAEDLSEFEKVLLKQFIQDKKIRVSPSSTGLYKAMMQEGRGRKVEKGDTVTVHYEGKFLNGKYFDSTKERKEPFTFVYGQEWQVVEGLEEAIGTMREGEKAMFIMPSQLAFGESGSSAGVIPPYTSLIFIVELVSIK